MDRLLLGSFPHVTEAVAVRGIAIEERADDDEVRGFLSDLADAGVTNHEALMLGDEPRDRWELLGYDAAAFLEAYLRAEDPDRGWSEDGWAGDASCYAVVAVSRPA